MSYTGQKLGLREHNNISKYSNHWFYSHHSNVPGFSILLPSVDWHREQAKPQFIKQNNNSLTVLNAYHALIPVLRHYMNYLIYF